MSRVIGSGSNNNGIAVGNPSALDGTFPMVIAAIFYYNVAGSLTVPILSRSSSVVNQGWVLQARGIANGFRFSKLGVASIDSTANLLPSAKWYMGGIYVTSTNVRFFAYDYALNTITFENVANSSAFSQASVDNAYVGSSWINAASILGFDGELEIVACWMGNSVAPTDDQLHNLAFSKAAWYEFGNPTSLWMLDQSDTTQKILDEQGVANESALTGTSVSAKSVPIWTPGIGPTNDFIRPPSAYTDAATITSTTQPSSADSSVHLSPYDAAALALSPQSHWKLDETSGTTFADIGGAGKTLSLIGTGATLGVAATKPGLGKHCNFGASSWAYVASSLTPPVSNKFSLGGWFYINSGADGFLAQGGPVPAASPYYPMCIEMGSSNFVSGHYGVLVASPTLGSLDSGVVRTTGVWVHLFEVYDGTTLKMYINGTAYSTSKVGSSISSMAGFCIGNIAGNQGAFNPDFRACSVSYWNDTVLSSTDIANLIAAASGYTDSDTISGITTPSGVESGYEELATITSSTTPSSVDTADYIETSTVSGVTTPSGIEAGSATTDAATLTSVTQPSSIETVDFVDAATLTSITVPSGSEDIPFVDADTPSTITEITAGEYNFTHPTGSWGVADTDDGVI